MSPSATWSGGTVKVPSTISAFLPKTQIAMSDFVTIHSSGGKDNLLQTKGDRMRMQIKLAIVKSGRPQYDIARELGVPESTLSKFVRGYGALQPEQEQKLHELLGLPAAPHDAAQAV